MAEKIGVAAYDIDGTLLPGSLTERAFWKMHEVGLITIPDAAYPALQQPHTPEVTHYIDDVVTRFNEWTRGVMIKAIKRAAEELAEEDAPRVFPEMQQRLASDREQHELVMISGSADLFVAPLARRLGSRIAVGSRYFISGGRLHQQRPPISRACDKHVLLAGIVRSLEATQQRPMPVCFAYGDTENDQTMLEMAKEAYVVNPTPGLRAYAERRGLPIIETVRASV